MALAGLIPIIKVNDAQDAVPLCRALQDAGVGGGNHIPHRAAEEAIRLVHEQVPDVFGAGTVLTPSRPTAPGQQARYIVSPGFNPRVVRHCLIGLSHFARCSSPSDIEQALKWA